nr:MAG: hypothetical protein [Caudoviricetes sp.]
MSIIEEIEQLNEKKRVLAEAPTTLMLQLKYVQPFPNGQKVALYFCPTIKKFFSFVYGKEGIIAEEDFSIIEKLKSISDIESIHFNDGSNLNINEECASKILELYESSENKFEFEEYILESETNFLNALEYSVTKQKQEQ